MFGHELKSQFVIPLGVLIARDDRGPRVPIDRWRAVSVMLDPPDMEPPRQAAYTPQPGLPRHVATLPLTLDRRRAMDYRINLANGVPSVYVVLRDAHLNAGAGRVDVRLVSASPFEVQRYREGGIELVDRVPMPDRLIEVVRNVIDLDQAKVASGSRA